MQPHTYVCTHTTHPHSSQHLPPTTHTHTHNSLVTAFILYLNSATLCVPARIPPTPQIPSRLLSCSIETVLLSACLPGSPPLTAVAAVHVHIIDSSSPLFEQSVYEASVPENVAAFTPVIPVNAISPHGQKLIYSISRGDKFGEFALDFNTGTNHNCSLSCHFSPLLSGSLCLVDSFVV